MLQCCMCRVCVVAVLCKNCVCFVVVADDDADVVIALSGAWSVCKCRRGVCVAECGVAV